MHSLKAIRGTALLIAGAMLITALVVLAGDGRLNTTSHLGGLVVYCVDSNRIPAADYEAGGIRLMYYANGTTSEVLFVSAAAIDRVGATPETNQTLGTWNGPYGVVSLYRLTTGEFQLNGNDEYGKQFVFTWINCESEGVSVPNGLVPTPKETVPLATFTPKPSEPTSTAPPPEQTPPL